MAGVTLARRPVYLYISVIHFGTRMRLQIARRDDGSYECGAKIANEAKYMVELIVNPEEFRPARYTLTIFNSLRYSRATFFAAG